MMKLAIFTIFLILCSCSKNDKKSSGSQCPSGTATSSNLPTSPAAETAVALHANGKDTSFYIQLSGTLNTSVTADVYDVDLFDTSSSKISSLKSSGKKVVCYFSAGSSENWRSDFDKFDSEDMGKPLDGWDGEKWLDVRSQNVLDLMKDRIDLAVTKGCDGVDPDNMDGYTQDSCFDISSDEQLAYNRAIANYARSQGLSVGLKNDPDQMSSLVTYFDFSVTEQCYEYSECSKYFPMKNANKPVFDLEYDTKYKSNPDRNTLCTYANANDIQATVYGPLLDNTYRYACF